jgi:pimeloyl-ACP methyl ester carboxylesterase
MFTASPRRRTRLAAIAAAMLAAPVLLSGCAGDIPARDLEARYMSAASRFVTVDDGTRVHVRDEGPRGAPAIVLLHGSNDSLQTWERWVQVLSPTYRVISMDLPGHGLTGPSASGAYGGDDYVAVVDAVVRALGVGRFAIGGNSMGGGVSWRYALAHPDKVRALVLVDAAGYPRPAEGRPPLIFRLAATPGVGEALARLTSRGMIENNLKEVIANDALVTDALVDRYFDMLRRDGNREATLQRMRGSRGDPEAWRRIATIRVPTLVIWGADDPWIPASDAARFAADIPGARTVIYPATGHLPQEERPLESAAEVRGFLDGLAQEPG